MHQPETCLDENTLAALGSGSLPSDVRARATQHLDGCERCRQELAAVAALELTGGASLTPDAPPAQAAPPAPAELAPGTAVGRFIVLHPVGKGGMGHVYAAYDSQLDRRVALKLLRPDVWGEDESEEGRGRLLREAQAMARLSHPHVVTVYEVGLSGRQLFIAMEYVEGQTLRAWLRERPRGWKEVLRVFVQAGRGLAAAHAKGLVHRDFKPENVLVGQDGRARVGDFGLVSPTGGSAPRRASAGAELLASPLASTTRSGAMLGTPGYMAPEQYAGALEVDARADQYAFCTALYEALYGQRPFPATTREALREQVLAGDVSEPPRASRVPARVRQAVLRGLRRQPAERFAQLEQLLSALEASLVSNRSRAVLAAAAVALVLLLGLGISSHLRERAQVCSGAPARLAGAWDGSVRERVRAALRATKLPYAEDTLRRVETGLDAYAQAWSSMHREACEATAVRQEQSAQLLDLRMRCLDARLGRLAALTEALSSDVTPAGLDKSVELVAGLEPLAGCADAQVLNAAYPPPPEAQRAQVAALTARLDKIGAYHQMGRFSDSLKVAAEVQKEAEALGYPPLVARATMMRANIGLELGKYQESIPLSLAGARAGAAAREDRAVAQGWLNLVWSYSSQSKIPEAQTALAAAEVSVARAGSPRDLRNLLASYRGNVYFAMDKQQEAADAVREALAIYDQSKEPLSTLDRIRYAQQLKNVSAALRQLGQLEQSRALAEKSITLLEAELGTEHPRVAKMYTSVGLLAADAGKLHESVKHYQKGLAILERTLPADSTNLGVPYSNYAVTLAELGRFDEAIRYYERSRDIWAKGMAPGNFRWAMQVESLGWVALAQGQDALARQRFDEALLAYEKALGPEHAEVASALSGLGMVETHARRWAEAERHLTRSLGIWDKASRKNGDGHVRTLMAMGDLELARGRASAALPFIERARTIVPEQGWDPWFQGALRFSQAQALWSTGQRPRALALAKEAQEQNLRSESYRARRALPVVKAWLAARGVGAAPAPASAGPSTP